MLECGHPPLPPPPSLPFTAPLFLRSLSIFLPLTLTATATEVILRKPFGGIHLYTHKNTYIHTQEHTHIHIRAEPYMSRVWQGW